MISSRHPTSRQINEHQRMHMKAWSMYINPSPSLWRLLPMSTSMHLSGQVHPRQLSISAHASASPTLSSRHGQEDGGELDMTLMNRIEGRKGLILGPPTLPLSSLPEQSMPSLHPINCKVIDEQSMWRPLGLEWSSEGKGLDPEVKAALKAFTPTQLTSLQASGFKSVLQVLLFYPKSHVFYSQSIDPYYRLPSSSNGTDAGLIEGDGEIMVEGRGLMRQSVALLCKVFKSSVKRFGMKGANLSMTLEVPCPPRPSSTESVSDNGSSDPLRIDVEVFGFSTWGMRTVYELQSLHPIGSELVCIADIVPSKEEVARVESDSISGSSDGWGRINKFSNIGPTQPILLKPSDFDFESYGGASFYKSKGGLKGADFNKRSKGGAGRGLVQRSIDYARKTTLVGLSPSSRKKGQGQDDQALSPPDPNVLHEALNPLHGLPIKALALLSSKPSSTEGSDSSSTEGSDSSSTERSDGSRPTLFNWLEAIEQIHWPTSSFFLAHAKRTLALTELTLSQLSLLYCRYRHRPHMHALTDHHSGGSQPVTIQGEGVGLTPGHRIDRGGVDEAILQLPFKLTRAQRVALEEVLSDMEGKGGSDGDDRPMQRLLQGDVGSGKTIVALLAMIAVAGTGRQAVLLAPTGVLAEQHHAKLQQLLSSLPPSFIEKLAKRSSSNHQRSQDEGQRVEGGDIEAEEEQEGCIMLLTSSTFKSKVEREKAYERIARGRVLLMVGTHSLLHVPTFFSLGLVCIDEQHKFGVDQKESLTLIETLNKNKTPASPPSLPPHVLSMSATPIPRALALVRYGEMELSVLNEAPPNRKPVITQVLEDNEDNRLLVFAKVVDELDRGGRAFVVYPLREPSLIESDEDDEDESEGKTRKKISSVKPSQDLRSAEVEFLRLRKSKAFGKHKCTLLHGKMTAEEKSQAIASFRDGTTPAMVCTVVVEVGVDVPEAGMMVVEHADRFGLAQLHQLRGRVGRGGGQASCFLLTSPQKLGADSSAEKRLNILEKCHDGFEIAESDLKLRGAGQVFGSGTKQSGGMDVSLLCEEEISRDPLLVDVAREAAKVTLDSLLVQPAVTDSSVQDQRIEDLERLMAAARAFELAVARIRKRGGGID